MMHDADDRIERLIDRAASALTEVPDSPAFTARVMARIDTAAAAHATAWRMPRLVPVSVAALLLVALAGWWHQGRDDAPVAPGATMHMLASRAVPTGAMAMPDARTAASPVPATPGGGRTTTTPGRSHATLTTEGTRLPGYGPITLEPVALSPVGTDDAGITVDAPLELPPIAVERLAINPIDLSVPPRSELAPIPGGRR